MKPFDLEKAIAWDPVITRDGRRAELHTYSFLSNHIIGSVINGPDICYWDKTGKSINEFVFGGSEELDLFMVPKKVKRWIWVSNKDLMFTPCRNTSFAYLSKEDLIKEYSGVHGEIEDGQILEIEVDE